MLRQRVELNLGTATELDPVTHLADPRPGQSRITCSARTAPAAPPRLGGATRAPHPPPPPPPPHPLLIPRPGVRDRPQPPHPQQFLQLTELLRPQRTLNRSRVL